jgi:hypothetical protein
MSWRCRKKEKAPQSVFSWIGIGIRKINSDSDAHADLNPGIVFLLKGQCQEIFYPWFFSLTISLGPESKLHIFNPEK